MKLFTFGDSWTEGVGGNIEDEYTTDIPEQKTIIRQKYCWPKHLSELFKCEVKNNGVGAFSNTAIFNAVCYQLKNKIITQDDFFIWGKRYKSKEHLLKYIFDGVSGTNINYNRAEKNFRDYYIGNLFNDTYYDIVNQNYILHLQFLFNEMGIGYLFCDAFDIMINKTIDQLVDKTDLINGDRYWGYQNKTMANLLIDTNRKDVWEDGNNWINITAGKHPSNNGYKLIADELYKFINEYNLLTYSKPKKSHLL